jgi:NMD protein affecting ribosome stability and mRNA decay
MVKCTQCAREITRLEVFPAGLCVDCYAMTDEANRPITARELAQMWGGK